jgi:hypothetical protein
MRRMLARSVLLGRLSHDEHHTSFFDGDKIMRRVTTALISIAMLSVAHGAEQTSAVERNPLESKFIAAVGYFFMSTDMRVRVDGETSNAVGTDVDYDDTFGIGDFDRFRADLSWRIAPRHVLRGMYFQNNRHATRSLEREVDFQDETFPVGATVDARSNLTVAQLSYEYAFVRRDNYELAGGIGIHYVDMELSLDATISAQGNQASRRADAGASTSAPLPVLGLRGLWRLPHNFYITALAQYFYLQLDPYSGSLIDLKASVVWQATDHFGIGIGYNDFGFRFDIEDRGDFDGRLRWDYGGAMAFATFMF